MKNDYLECAKVAGTHGVHGALKLISMCDSPEVLASLPEMYIKNDDEYLKMNVTHSFVQKSSAVVSFDTIDSLEKAIPMKNKTLYASRKDIPLKKGSYFISDLIGLEIRDHENNELYGLLEDVISPAGRDIYVVRTETGEFMIPCVPEFIIDILPNQRKITVKLIPGMLG